MKTYLQALFLSTLSVFAPIKAVIVTTLVLVLADLILGVLAAKKRGELLTSAGLRRTITKIFVYETALMLAFLTEQYLTGELVPVCKIVSSFIGLVELKSCTENLNEISGGSLLKVLLEKLGSVNEKGPDVNG